MKSIDFRYTVFIKKLQMKSIDFTLFVTLKVLKLRFHSRYDPINHERSNKKHKSTFPIIMLLASMELLSQTIYC